MGEGGARPPSRASLSRGATPVGRKAAVARDRAPGQGRQRTRAGAAQEADKCPRGKTDSSPAFPFALVPPPVLFALQQRSWALFGLKMSASAARAQVCGGGRGAERHGAAWGWVLTGGRTIRVARAVDPGGPHEGLLRVSFDYGPAVG